MMHLQLVTYASPSTPSEHLQKKYKHLRGLPIPAVKEVEPLLLLGSDHAHLITPAEPIRLGPPGGSAATYTCLGWTLQGPLRYTGWPSDSVQCLFTSLPAPKDELYCHVERLWQVDTIPHRPEKEVTRSRQDQQAVTLLEAKTTLVEVDSGGGMLHCYYVT